MSGAKSSGAEHTEAVTEDGHVRSVVPEDIPTLAGERRSDGPPGDERHVWLGLPSYRTGASGSTEERRIGDQMDRFIVEGVLGRGGMSTVLEAYDPTLRRKVALKVLHPEFAARRQDRLLREAVALARLSHPNVVQIYSMGRIRQQFYIAMELVQGSTLQQWQQRQKRRSWQQSIDYYVQAGLGLVAAHAKGLVHRDFKPSNCIVDPRGRVRVLDFGLVRDLSELSGLTGHLSETDPKTPNKAASLDIVPRQLTGTGAMLGTVAYIAPEQLKGQQADTKSDQFSFCVSLYEAVYGHRPFAGTTAYELTLALEGGVIRPPPLKVYAPQRLRRVLLRGLSYDPDERWPSMDALLDALVEITKARQRWWWVTTALGLPVCGIIVASLLQPQPQMCEDAQEKLVGIWDDGIKAQANQAMLDTEVVYAPDTWQRLSPMLDDYASGWAAGYTDACTDTHQDGHQTASMMDARMQCLDGRLRRFAAFVGALKSADETVVQRAIEAAYDLPTVDRCADEAYVTTRTPLPEGLQAPVTALGSLLTEAKALMSAGKYDEGLELAGDVQAEAETLGYEPLVAESTLLVGQLLNRTSHYAAAVESLERAYFAATSLGLDEVKAEAVVELLYVLGDRRMQYDKALDWGNHAEAAVERLSDERLRFVRLEYLGIVHRNQGKYEEALELFHQAIEGTVRC